MKRILTVILFLTLAAAVPVIAQDGQAAVQEARQRAEVATRVAQQRAAGLAAIQEAAPAEAREDDEIDEAFDRGGADAAVANQTEEVEDDVPPSPPVEELPEGTMRFHLMDGSILTGTLAVDSLPVDTEFGRLIVPIDSIKSFEPGLNAHPQLADRIDTLISQLGSPNAAQRDRAQADLISFGPGLIDELQRHADDPDDERKLRIATVLEELYGMMDDPMGFEEAPAPSLARMDHVVTDGFTIAGSIAVDTFVIESKFGQLTVGLGDIQSAGIVTSAVPDIRRTVEVVATDMTRVSEKNTGIRLNRGDRVIIRAEGQITMTPWGNGAIATPDGCAQSGNFAGNILMGALVGRVGDNGSDMLIGSSSTFTAERAGTLYLSFALQPNWGRQQFPGKFTVRIRIVPAQ